MLCILNTKPKWKKSSVRWIQSVKTLHSTNPLELFTFKLQHYQVFTTKCTHASNITATNRTPHHVMHFCPSGQKQQTWAPSAVLAWNVWTMTTWFVQLMPDTFFQTVFSSNVHLQRLKFNTHKCKLIKYAHVYICIQLKCMQVAPCVPYLIKWPWNTPVFLYQVQMCREVPGMHVKVSQGCWSESPQKTLTSTDCLI